AVGEREMEGDRNGDGDGVAAGECDGVGGAALAVIAAGLNTSDAPTPISSEQASSGKTTPMTCREDRFLTGSPPCLRCRRRTPLGCLSSVEPLSRRLAHGTPPPA